MLLWKVMIQLRMTLTTLTIITYQLFIATIMLPNKQNLSVIQLVDLLAHVLQELIWLGWSWLDQPLLLSLAAGWLVLCWCRLDVLTCVRIGRAGWPRMSLVLILQQVSLGMFSRPRQSSRCKHGQSCKHFSSLILVTFTNTQWPRPERMWEGTTKPSTCRKE